MNIAIIGSNGQLGSDIYKAYYSIDSNIVLSFTHAHIEVTDLNNVREAFRSLQPDVIVNCAVVHTKESESDPGKSYLVNAIGARNVATVAKEHNALLQHISTELVFSGDSTVPYTEFCVESPRTVYGSTKLAGEHFVRNSEARHQIFRTTALFGHNPTRGKPGGLNFVDLMLDTAKSKGVVRLVTDEFTAPTSTASLAKQLVVMSTERYEGVFHAVGDGGCSWYEFAKEIFAQAGIKVRMEVLHKNGELARSKYLIMDNCRLKHLGLNVFKPWREELSTYLKG